MAKENGEITINETQELSEKPEAQSIPQLIKKHNKSIISVVSVLIAISAIVYSRYLTVDLGPKADTAVKCLIDLDACDGIRATEKAEHHRLETELLGKITVLETMSIPARVQTVIVQETVEIEVSMPIKETVIVQVTSEPTPRPFLITSQGSCDDSEPPCTYVTVGGDSWPTIAYNSDYSDSCKWPEIANLNRLSDGRYDIPLLKDKSILFPEAAPIGQYRPQFWNDQGRLEVIQECFESFSFPCAYTVQDEIEFFRYDAVASAVYKTPFLYGYDLGAWISDANKASDCSNKPITLRPGVSIVIPKKPIE